MNDTFNIDGLSAKEIYTLGRDYYDDKNGLRAVLKVSGRGSGGGEKAYKKLKKELSYRTRRFYGGKDTVPNIGRNGF